LVRVSSKGLKGLKMEVPVNLVVLFVLENNKNGKLENNKVCSSYFENKNGSYREMISIWKTKMAASVT
jgi:hypothetical protein